MDPRITTAGADPGNGAAGDRAEREGPSIRFTARFWPLFRIWLGNLLLTIITLSFYRFWGRTRVRRFLWRHFEIDGDGLEYTGTGRELFIGFLILTAVLVPFLIVQGLLNSLLADPLAALAQAAVYILLLYLGGYAYYRSRRYRLSRTLWRGIRPQLSGSPWQFANLVTGYTLGNILTLGLIRPIRDRALTRRLLTDIRIGSLSPTFRPQIRPLFIIQLFGFPLTSLVAAIAWGSIVLADPTSDATQIIEGTAPLSIPLLLLWLLFINTLYSGKRYHLFAAGTGLGDVTFTMTPGFWAVLRLKAGNFLLQLIMLGTGSAFTQYRTAGFYARHLKAHGRLDTASMHQHDANETGFGDDIADVFTF